jgi:hypothetical protein
MATIKVIKLSAHQFEVTVYGQTNTAHQVTVSELYAKKLIGNRRSTEALLHDSFEFLLAREANTSILRNFDLSAIADYFPDYERLIG